MHSDRPSLRSLAPLLNHLPPPPSPPQLSARRPLPPEHAFDSQDHNPPVPLHPSYSQPRASPPPPESAQQQRAILKSSSLDSSSGASDQSPPTPSAHPFHPLSPSSYHAYRPEWTSVSSPILASSFDHPDYRPALPSKRPRQLLNPACPTPFPKHPHHHTDTHQHLASNPPGSTGNSIGPRLAIADPHPLPHTEHPTKPPSGSCSASSREADDRQHPDHHPPGSHAYSHLSALPHPILLDDDRGLCARPLKNTKRAAQNRAAQRAFRERKDRYVRELEARSVQFEEYLVRYGLLEERERHIAAREAELLNTRPPSRPADEGASMDREPATRDGEEKAHHIDQLERQLETSRQEIARLRVELMKFHHEEEMDHSRRGVVDWQRGKGEHSLPRTGYASDLDTGAQASCSSGSPSALRDPRKTTAARSSPRAHHTAAKNPPAAEPTQRDRMWLDEKAHGDRSPIMSIATEIEMEPVPGHKYLSNGWSDGGDSPDSLPASHRQTHSARPGTAPNNFEQTRQQSFPPAHQNGGSALAHHSIPGRIAITHDGPERLVRLPAIQSHPKHAWGADHRPQLAAMKLSR